MDCHRENGARLSPPAFAVGGVMFLIPCTGPLAGFGLLAASDGARSPKELNKGVMYAHEEMPHLRASSREGEGLLR